MPTCQNCHNKWSWKQTMKKMFTLDTGMNCPYCGERQYQTRKSRKNAGLLNFFILLPLLLNIFFDIPAAILLSSFPVLFFLVMSLNPVLMHLSSKEEYSF
ncbi:hypothetical protein FH966_03085 [Lentibacillus cibarius]|uniref:Cxxc_20_cxxc protein n=1 Tax=Lentibacillus cibarius TaxID=2583219 RepID=A0A549YFW8_9BACI|nr:TIGR04104 family putative zinc finger protein [Lentibacillus cibarius]TRM10781.1 hypothetical protein FH966_03085 [Lentibacillus cibarius]